MRSPKRHMNVEIDKLYRIAWDLDHVVRKLRKNKPVPLTKKQHRALGHVLRTLDIRNEYALGDELRRAFNIELDGLHDASN